MRVCKIGAHELGHMFGLAHCIYYQCLMMGTNNLEQTDRNPLQFCAVCDRKLHKCINFEHVQRSKALLDCCEEFGGKFTEPNRFEING